MNRSTSKILHQIFNAESLKEVSLSRLEGLRDQFPYFAGGHYFLSKKQWQEQETGYAMEAKKTAIYFNNPYWLQWLLENDQVEAIPKSAQTIEEPATDSEKAKEEFSSTINGSSIDTSKDNIEKTEPAHVSSLEENNTIPPFHEPIILLPNETIESSHQANEEMATEKMVEENSIETSSPELINQELPASNPSVELEKITESNWQSETENTTVIEHPVIDKPREPELKNNLSENFAKNLPLFSSNEVKEGFLFEPYHTVDYFAFLGVKLQMDEPQPDKFGKQLKSFTDWLKSMKKLPQKTDEHAPIGTDEAAVEGYAAHSNLQKEIITEAMAEVLSKQGKNENAIELYRKLSLINPAKSIYFATKIEQLKEH